MRKVGLFVVCIFIASCIAGYVGGDHQVESFKTTVVLEGEDMRSVIERVNGVSVDDSFVEEVVQFNLISETCVEVGCEVSIPVIKN